MEFHDVFKTDEQETADNKDNAVFFISLILLFLFFVLT